MKLCAVRGGRFGGCEGRIEFDHSWIYAAKQINEVWAIIGLCQYHHYAKDGNKELKNAVLRVSLKLATAEDLAKYPRKDWAQLRRSVGLSPTPPNRDPEELSEDI